MPCLDFSCGDVCWLGHVFSLVIPPVIQSCGKWAALKAVPSKLPNSPETQNTTLERMVFCVTKGDFTVLGMLSIAHSVLHRNRKTVPMLWQESADYITRTTNPYPPSQYSCHSSCLAVLFQTPWSYIVITTFYRKPLVAQ